jgi:hypothetical protein
MAHYMVRYSRGTNNNYVYPESVVGVVWMSVVYHYTDQVMVGETDATVETDEKQVATLTADDANKLVEEYQASYPKSPDLVVAEPPRLLRR